MDKALREKLIAEMRRVRDEVMPAAIIGEFRGSRVSRDELAQVREVLDRATNALAEQNGADCLEAFGELRTLQ